MTNLKSGTDNATSQDISAIAHARNLEAPRYPNHNLTGPQQAHMPPQHMHTCARAHSDSAEGRTGSLWISGTGLGTLTLPVGPPLQPKVNVQKGGRLRWLPRTEKSEFSLLRLTSLPVQAFWLVRKMRMDARR